MLIHPKRKIFFCWCFKWSMLKLKWSQGWNGESCTLQISKQSWISDLFNFYNPIHSFVYLSLDLLILSSKQKLTSVVLRPRSRQKLTLVHSMCWLKGSVWLSANICWWPGCTEQFCLLYHRRSYNFSDLITSSYRLAG